MRLPIGLGIGGLLALVVGLVLPHLPDWEFHDSPGIFGNKENWGNGYPSFQTSAAVCPHVNFVGIRDTPATFAYHASFVRSCATASDVMNLGAWLVVLGALVLVVAVVVLILGRIRRRSAVGAPAV